MTRQFMAVTSLLLGAALATAYAGAAEDPAALASGAGCDTCHREAQPMLGPSWQAVAERYRDSDTALEDISARMREGSRGVWGRVPMPPVEPGQLTDDQLAIVLEWILTR
jgi:cytochrome c